ncbi:hypothetical protein SDC9_189136 [bioreactor metagenome]|uniref:Uncharacterized protein n=1 Tax=bioreactor metagenome TaxID=1076179 RepID=A0A645HSY6_9ZZZZ
MHRLDNIHQNHRNDGGDIEIKAPGQNTGNSHPRGSAYVLKGDHRLTRELSPDQGENVAGANANKHTGNFDIALAQQIAGQGYGQGNQSNGPEAGFSEIAGGGAASRHIVNGGGV